MLHTEILQRLSIQPEKFFLTNFCKQVLHPDLDVAVLDIQLLHSKFQLEVLALQEGGSQSNLILLQTSRLPGSLSSHVVPHSFLPVLPILLALRSYHLPSLLDDRLRPELLCTERSRGWIKV